MGSLKLMKILVSNELINVLVDNSVVYLIWYVLKFDPPNEPFNMK